MGFTFNNIHSDVYKIAASIKYRPLIPEKRQFSEYIIGRDGKAQVEDGYNDAVVELECQIGSYSPSELRTTARAISAWLRSVSETETAYLELDDEPGMLYTVSKVVNDIQVAREGRIDSFTLSFTCLPYQQMNNQAPVQTVVGADTITIVNGGNYRALPVITLAGTALSITIGTFTIDVLSGTVYVDCENKLVYSISGEDKVNEIGNFTGDFLELSPGSNSIAVSGSITSVNVTIDYWDTYL